MQQRRHAIGVASLDRARDRCGQRESGRIERSFILSKGASWLATDECAEHDTSQLFA
jgi:hypothetical protein